MAIWPACSAVFVRSWGIKRYNWTMLFRGEDSSSSWLLIISSTDSFLRARESRSYVELRSGPVSANCNSPKYQTIVMYNETVTINASGNSTAGYITFQSYPGQTAIIDGTGLAVNGQTGLINIQDQSYLVVRGFEIRNYSTSSTANVPIGIYITGADSYIQILNNHIHNIKTSASGCNANALGIAVYGDNGSSSINNQIGRAH